MYLTLLYFLIGLAYGVINSKPTLMFKIRNFLYWLLLWPLGCIVGSLRILMSVHQVLHVEKMSLEQLGISKEELEALLKKQEDNK